MEGEHKKQILIDHLLELGYYKTEKGYQLYELSLQELKEAYFSIEKDRSKHLLMDYILKSLSDKELKMLLA